MFNSKLLNLQKVKQSRESIIQNHQEIKKDLETLVNLQSVVNIFKRINRHLDCLIKLQNSTSCNSQVDKNNQSFVDRYSRALFSALNQDNSIEQIFKNFPREISPLVKGKFAAAEELYKIEGKYQQITGSEDEILFKSLVKKEKETLDKDSIFYRLENCELVKPLVFSYPLATGGSQQGDFFGRGSGKFKIIPSFYIEHNYYPSNASWLPNLNNGYEDNQEYVFKKNLTAEDLILYRKNDQWIDEFQKHIEGIHVDSFQYSKYERPSIEAFLDYASICLYAQRLDAKIHDSKYDDYPDLADLKKKINKIEDLGINLVDKFYEKMPEANIRVFRQSTKSLVDEDKVIFLNLMHGLVDKEEGFLNLKNKIENVKEKLDVNKNYDVIQRYSIDPDFHYPEIYLRDLAKLGIFDKSLVKFSDEFIEELKNINQKTKL